MQLKRIELIKARLILLSGLHIGAGDNEISIGSIDNNVIKHPFTDEPYIPGSSLKGKIRSLLEWRSGAVQEDPLNVKSYSNAASNAAQQSQVLQILQLFGLSGDNKDPDFAAKVGHTRAAFWDCTLNDTWRKNTRDSGLALTEVKMENSINRISSVAQNPRQTERVPAGAEFDFTVSLKVFSGDGKQLRTTLLRGLKLLELDSLGGSGSRGYGKVKFTDLTVDRQDYQEEFDKLDPFGSDDDAASH